MHTLYIQMVFENLLVDVKICGVYYFSKAITNRAFSSLNKLNKY